MCKFSKDLKKQLLTSSLVGLVIAASSNVHAAVNIDIKATANFYFGASIGHNKYLVSNNFTSALQNRQSTCKSSSLNLLTPIVGMQFNDKYGIEFSYGIYNDLKFSGTRVGNLEIRNYFLDVTGSIPAPGSLGEEIDFIGGIGFGRMHLKENGNLQAMGNGSSYNKFGFRVKAGVQYPLDQSWNIRGLFAYQRVGDLDGKSSIKTMRSLNLDLLYIV